MRSQCLSMRQHSAGAQAKPPSISTTFSFGKALEHALEDQARHQCSACRWHDGVVLLHVIGRPARAGRGVAAAEAVRRAARSADLQRSAASIDRPVAAVAERVARARRHDDLRRSADRRRAARSPSTAKAASSCGTTMPARSRGSGLTQASSCQSLIGVRQRRGEFEIALLHAAVGAAASACRTRRRWRSRCCRRINVEIGAGRPVLRRKASTPQCRRHHARIGELAATGPGADAPPKVVHVLAPARRQERMQVAPACCSAGWMSQSTMRELAARLSTSPDRNVHRTVSLLGGIIADAPPRANADRSRADCRSASAAACVSGSPSGSTSSPSNCQCG